MAESKAEVTASAAPVAKPRSSLGVFIDRALSALSSVKLGITLMLLLILFSILGTVIIQYNIDGFDKYYTSLTPAQRQLYHDLGLFDLFHTRWFTALLCLFSLNLILVSIDLFPKTWRFAVAPKRRASVPFLKAQPFYRSFRLSGEADIVDRVSAILRSFRWRVRVTPDRSRTTVFAERGVWNRFVVFIIHIAVLVIVGAGFVGSQWGYEGVMPLAPGETANFIRVSGAPVLEIPDRTQALPFQVVCNNLRVDLRDPDGPLAQGNFDNWYTDVTFVKGDETLKTTVYLNHPVDYDGYRFFQASFGPPGEASHVTIDVTSRDGSGPQPIELTRNEPVTIDGLGQVTFARFISDFGIVEGQPQSVGQEYRRPAAQIEIVNPTGERARTFAFSPDIMAFIESQTGMVDQLRVEGRSFTLREFTRAPSFHVLQVQYDPGVDAVYFGFFLLCASLIAVFMFSHERVWAVIERQGDETYLHLGANTNRHQLGLEKKFAALTQQLTATLGVEEVPARTATAEA